MQSNNEFERIQKSSEGSPIFLRNIFTFSTMSQIRLIKSALHTFYDVEITPDPTIENIIEEGLDSMLKSVDVVMHKALGNMNCYKFYLISNALFKVNFILEVLT